MTETELEDVLHKEGWPIERLDETTWRSSFEGASGPQRFFVRLTDHFLLLTVAPYLGPARSAARRLKLYQRLLEINREMNLAKLAIDPDGDTVLTIELPTEHLDETLLEAALATLSHYGDRYKKELLALLG